MDRVSWADVLRAAAHLLENPEELTRLKDRFSLEVLRAAVKLAEQNGMPADVLAQLKRDLGV